MRRPAAFAAVGLVTALLAGCTRRAAEPPRARLEPPPPPTAPEAVAGRYELWLGRPTDPAGARAPEARWCYLEVMTRPALAARAWRPDDRAPAVESIAMTSTGRVRVVLTRRLEAAPAPGPDGEVDPAADPVLVTERWTLTGPLEQAASGAEPARLEAVEATVSVERPAPRTWKATCYARRADGEGDHPDEVMARWEAPRAPAWSEVDDE